MLSNFQKEMKRNLKNSKLGRAWKKIRDFLNKDDSVLSLLANIAIAFIVIKYLVYPGLGLILGTSYPIVAVVSGSMEHDGSFDDWWKSDAIYESQKINQDEFYQNYGITKSEFKEFSFKNGFNTGDIMILTGKDAENIEVGDVIVFRSTRPDPIIHRVIEKNIKDDKIFFKTKGDHNPTTHGFESSIPENDVIGVARFRVPYLGWVKIGAVNLIQSIMGIF